MLESGEHVRLVREKLKPVLSHGMRGVMRRRQVTPAALARITRLNQSMVYDYCRGTKLPSLPTLYIMKYALRCTWEELLGDGMADDHDCHASMDEPEAPTIAHDRAEKIVRDLTLGRITECDAIQRIEGMAK